MRPCRFPIDSNLAVGYYLFMVNTNNAAAAGYVIILTIDNDGPVYLGRVDCGRQGVRRIENAIFYKTRSRAALVAADYGHHASVMPV